MSKLIFPRTLTSRLPTPPNPMRVVKNFFNPPLRQSITPSLPKRFRSANVGLNLELISIVIEQISFSIALSEDNSIKRGFPLKTFEQLLADGDISIKWFMDGSEVVGENEATLPLDKNNGDQGKNVYLEVTDFNNNIFTSNTVTGVQEKFLPIQLNSLTLWLDASDESTIVKDNNRVSQWNDKSTNQIVYSSSNGYEPIYDDSITSIDFGNEQYTMQASNTLSPAISPPYAIINVSQFRSFSTDWQYMYGGIDSNHRNLFINRDGIWFQYTPDADWESNKNDSTLTPDTNKHIFTNVVSSNGSWISLDGQPKVDQQHTPGTINFVGLTLGAFYGDYPSSRFDGYHQSIIVVQTDDLSIIKKIEGYLAHKWNLTNNLPSNHPYKNTEP